MLINKVQFNPYASCLSIDFEVFKTVLHRTLATKVLSSNYTYEDIDIPAVHCGNVRILVTKINKHFTF